MQEIIIGPNEAGQRFDKYLAKYIDLAPKSFLYKMLRKKNITLNGKKAAGSEKLSEGDLVRLFLSDETISKFQSFSRSCDLKKLHTDSHDRPDRLNKLKSRDILYEDRNTIFINKPAGMLSQKSKPDDISAVEYLISYLLDTDQITKEELKTFHPSVCNRLDRNTSGILAAGKTLAALQQLSEMFRTRNMKKYYLCLVKGNVSGQKKISGYLTKDRKSNRVRLDERPSESSSRIETEYRAVSHGDGVTLLEVHLITGKTHQIRIHMASEGYPIVGDYKYGDRAFNDILKKSCGLKSQLLHAARLCIPECGGALSNLSGCEIRAPLPDLFVKVLKEKGVDPNGYLEFTRATRLHI